MPCGTKVYFLCHLEFTKAFDAVTMQRKLNFVLFTVELKLENLYVGNKKIKSRLWLKLRDIRGYTYSGVTLQYYRYSFVWFTKSETCYLYKLEHFIINFITLLYVLYLQELCVKL